MKMKAVFSIVFCLSFIQMSPSWANTFINPYMEVNNLEPSPRDFVQSWFEEYIVEDLKEGDEFEVEKTLELSPGSRPFYQVRAKLDHEPHEKLYWIDGHDVEVKGNEGQPIIITVRGSSFLLSAPVRQHQSSTQDPNHLNLRSQEGEDPLESLLVLTGGSRSRVQSGRAQRSSLPAALRFAHVRVADRPECRLAPALPDVTTQSRVAHPGPQMIHRECSKFIDEAGNYGNYGKFIYNHISRERYPQFFQPNRGIVELCPRFESFLSSDDQVKNFWVWFFMSLSFKESSCDNLARGQATMANDTAVGLLQLSSNVTYRSHQTEICRDTTVCNPYENLTCGVSIVLKNMMDNQGAILVQPGRTYFRNFWRGPHSRVFRSRLALFTPCFR